MTNVPQPRPATAVTPVTQFVGSCAPQVRLFPDDPNSDPEHSFRPCSVPWFINQVQLVQGTSTTPPPLQALPVATASAYLAMPVGPTWQDNLAIRMGDLATATSYVYIRQVDELPGLWDLQYWLFYAVRGFSTARVHSATTDQSYDLAIPPSLGIQAYQGLGEHQGDFKHVTVRIDTSGNILGIYYAQHTKGVWCFPGEYETVADSNGNLHPVVYSARNTHSCLPHAGRFDQLGAVLPLPSTPVSSAVTFSLMEQTQDGGQYWNLWDNYTVVDNSPNPQWLQFLGHWGPTLNQASFLQDLVNSMVKALKINPIFGGPIAAVLERLLVWKQDGASTPRVQKPWINGDGLYTWSTVDPTHAWSTSGGPVSVVTDPDPVLNRLDVFICGQNGHVYNIGHTQGSGWDPQWGQVQPGSAYSMSGGLVTAAYRPGAGSTALDLFIYGRNGFVYTVSRDPGAGWDAKWAQVGPPFAGAANHHMPISAVYQPGAPTSRLDVFVCDSAGSVRTIGRTGDAGWDSGWSSAIQRASAYSTPGGAVTAVWSPGGERITLFMCGRGGQVYAINGTQGGPDWEWDSAWRQLGSKVSVGGAPVSAVYQPVVTPTPDALQVFMGGSDGQVYEMEWTEAAGWPTDWTQIPCPSFGVPPFMAAWPIHTTAVWRDSNHLDLFCAPATNGDVYVNGWAQAKGKWGTWTTVSPSTGWTSIGSLITAWAPDPNSWDLFMCGQNGRVFKTRYFPYDD